MCEEEAWKVQEAWEEAECQAQEEAWKARKVQEAWEALENEINTHPEEDGDYVPDNAMDVDDGTVSPLPPSKQPCRTCTPCTAHHLSSQPTPSPSSSSFQAWVKKWKQLAAEGTVLTRAPPGVVCTECASRKYTCVLPELENEQSMIKSALKQKREEDDELQVSESKESGGATFEGAEEVPKKRSRMQELWVREKSMLWVGEKKEGQGKIVEALEYIRKGLPALVRVVNNSNRHLATIANYVDQCEWDSEDGESEEEDEESEEEWGSGDDEVACGLGSGKK